MDQSNKPNPSLLQTSELKVDRSVFVVTTLHGESDEKVYWHNQTPQQRLEAIELNRRTVYGYGDQEASRRLQRVLEIIERQ